MELFRIATVMETRDRVFVENPLMLGLCEDKTRLLIEYNSLLRKYSQAVSDLVSYIGYEEFEFIRHTTRNAHALAEKARQELEKHVAEHGCRSILML